MNTDIEKFVFDKYGEIKNPRLKTIIMSIEANHNPKLKDQVVYTAKRCYHCRAEFMARSYERSCEACTRRMFYNPLTDPAKQ